MKFGQLTGLQWVTWKNMHLEYIVQKFYKLSQKITSLTEIKKYI